MRPSNTKLSNFVFECGGGGEVGVDSLGVVPLKGSGEMLDSVVVSSGLFT
jgi:hypothetical protein